MTKFILRAQDSFAPHILSLYRDPSEALKFSHKLDVYSSIL